MEINPRSFPISIRCDRKLFEWALCFIDRFPKWVDLRLLKGLYVIFGVASTSFFEKRDPFHLKRLLLSHFFLQKRIEEKLKKGVARQSLVRVFLINSRLCITIAYSKRKSPLTDDIVLEIASQRILTLKKVDFSTYQWTSQDFPYSMCYLEVEKMRGVDLTSAEAKAVETHLSNRLTRRTSEPSIFWPYNREEAFKQLLALGKEISSLKDIPEVSIHFQKQMSESLEFIVYLVRPKKCALLPTSINQSHLSRSTQLVHHLQKELETAIPALAEVISFIVPMKNFQVDNTINLLHAREFIVKLLEDSIGPFRDYNGGLFETQKNHFSLLAQRASNKVPQFSLFGEDLFYSIEPIESQICLEASLFESLFEEFSKVLLKRAPFLHRPNAHILILKVREYTQLAPHLEQAKKLEAQGKIAAYASLKVLSDHYLCLIDRAGNDLTSMPFDQCQTDPSSRKEQVLRLGFQAGELPSFHPRYLVKETRGRTIGKLLFEGLFRLKSKNQIKHTGCKRFTLSKNKKRYLFELRTHYWSNGKEVTSFDYEKTWKANFLAKGDLNPLYILKNADAIRKGEKPIHSLGVKAIDKQHLQVDLEREDLNFLEKLAHPFFFPSLEESSETRNFNGPYRIRKKEKQKLFLEKNPYYWDRKNLFFEEIKISFAPSCRGIYKLIQKEKIDWIGNPCTYDITMNNPSIKKDIFFPFFIYFNTKIPPLSSPLIRQALSCVLDRRFIGEHIFPGSQPLFTFFPSEVSLCQSRFIDNNLTRGKELFERGLKQLGLTRKTLPRLKLISPDIEKSIKLAKYLQEKWRESFDICIDSEIQNWNSFYQKIEQGSFHLGGFCKWTFPSDPELFLESFACGENNFSQWESKDYSDRIALAKKAKSKKLRKHYLGQAEDLLIEHAPAIPLFSLGYSYTHLSGLKNYIFDQEGNVDFSFASMPIAP